TAPPVGAPGAILQFTPPTAPGTYQFRWFVNNTFPRLATSSTVTVLAPPPPPPPAVTVSATTVNPGDPITVTLANGPGNPMDWVTLGATSAADSAYLAWKFLNGSTTGPA